nr:MAG TPA: putative GntR-family transcriptional regulator [Caudoviricetes sp.]
MGKGFAKIYQSEADNPKLWENATLYLVYQKLKTVAWWPEGTIKRPCRALAKRLAVSINTLRKAVAGLEELGLVEVALSDRNTWALRVKYVEQEPRQNTPLGEPAAADGLPTSNDTENAAPSVLEPAMAAAESSAQVNHFNQTDKMVPPVSKNDTTGANLYQNLTQVVSKNDTTACQNLTQPPLYRDYLYINNIYTPYNPPMNQKLGFETFWTAYPNKKGKQPALKKWNSGKYDPDIILPVLEKQKKLRDWVKQDGHFVPLAKTYLNQKRYEDCLPQSEEYYILNFEHPQTAREKTLRAWIEATNPALLKNDNKKINNVFETDRALFEQIVAKCGGDLDFAFAVMRHGWQLGCNTMRAIAERAAAYINDLNEKGVKQ